VEVPDDFGFVALALLVVLFLGLSFGLGASSCNTLQSVQSAGGNPLRSVPMVLRAEYLWRCRMTLA
jgi:hypothetical protein